MGFWDDSSDDNASKWCSEGNLTVCWQLEDCGTRERCWLGPEDGGGWQGARELVRREHTLTEHWREGEHTYTNTQLCCCCRSVVLSCSASTASMPFSPPLSRSPLTVRSASSNFPKVGGASCPLFGSAVWLHPTSIWMVPTCFFCHPSSSSSSSNQRRVAGAACACYRGHHSGRAHDPSTQRRR